MRRWVIHSLCHVCILQDFSSVIPCSDDEPFITSTKAMEFGPATRRQRRWNASWLRGLWLKVIPWYVHGHPYLNTSINSYYAISYTGKHASPSSFKVQASQCRNCLRFDRFGSTRGPRLGYDLGLQWSSCLAM